MVKSFLQSLLLGVLFLGGALTYSIPLQASRQMEVADSVIPSLIHRVGIDMIPGYIYQTRPFLRGRNQENKSIRTTFATHLKYSFQFGPNTRLGRLYPHTAQGIGVSFDTFFRKRELGQPFTVYLFQTSRICDLNPRLSFDYEWNFGVSTGWKYYLPVTNKENDVIGSPLNAHLYLALLLNYRLSHHWNLLLGIGGSHFSNGNTFLPNWGLNTVGVHVGVVRTLNASQSKVAKADVFVPSIFQPHLSYDLMVYGSSRQKKIHKTDDYLAFIAHGYYAVTGLNFSPMYHFNRYFRGGASLDIQYDASANIKDYMLDDPEESDRVHFGRPPLSKQLGVGLSIRGELVMPILSLNVGVGKNIFGRGSDLKHLYQVFGLKIRFNRELFLNIGYQLYKFKEPNGLMLGLGFTFHAR